MKSILILSLLFVSLSLSAQKMTKDGKIRANLDKITAGGSAALLENRKVEQSIYIQPTLQNSIKSLNDQMKPYEEMVKEYNRLLGLKITIYQTIIQSKGIGLDSLAAEPIFLQDSIKIRLKSKQ